MKKRVIGLVAALILVCGALPTLAAGGIGVTEETWYVLPHSSNYRVYYYAVVTNTAGEPEKINDLLFEIRDDADTAIESTAKYKLYPEILQPGQSGWLVITQDVKDIEDKSPIDHYALTITSKAVDDEAARLLSARGEYLAENEDENEDILRVAVTNDGEGRAFGITVAALARDGEGRIACVASATTRDIGLDEGGTLLVRTAINADIMDELTDTGAEIASVEALAYLIEDVD